MKKTALYCFLLLVLQFGYIFTWAQNIGFNFTNYTSANGLCYNKVDDILQDSRGFMWFATSEGLSRFDGTAFKNFYADKNDSNIFQGNSISNLNEYKKDSLLFLSSGKVWCMNTANLQFHLFQPLASKYICKINGSADGYYFFSGIDTCFVTNSSLEIIQVVVPPLHQKQSVTGTALDQNKWFFECGEEFFFYDLQSKSFIRLALQEHIDITGEKGLSFKYYDVKNKSLYLYRYFGGLYKFSTTGQLLHHWIGGNKKDDLTVSAVASIIKENDSMLWVGTQFKGFNLVNLNTNTVTQFVKDENKQASLISNSIQVMYKDRDKNIWIGTNEGVSKINNLSRYIKYWHEEFTTEDKRGELKAVIKAADENIYVSFYLSKTYRIIKSNGDVEVLENKKNPGAWGLHNDGKKLMISGEGPLMSYNVQTGNYKTTDFLKNIFPKSSFITLAFKHANGDSWYSVNGDGGFIRKEAGTGKIHVYKKDGDSGKFAVSHYDCYTESEKGDLYFGQMRSSKMLHWSLAKDRFDEIDFTKVKGTSTKTFSGITTLATDNKGNIWIGFDGTGMIEYDAVADNSRYYSLEDGLPTNHVNTLVFDNSSRLWIGSVVGLSCLLVDGKTFVTFKKSDGLPEDNFSIDCGYFDSAANKIWLGAQSTLMSFDPDTLLSLNKKSFPIYIDGLLVNGASYKFIDTLNTVFNPSQNNLQFQFIAVDIDNGKDIEYSYMLAGADKNWIYNGSAITASYANLNSGHYIFKVRARHKGDNVWTEISTAFPFYIKTAWNKSWWFIALLCIVIFLTIFVIIRNYYLRKLEKQQAIIEKQSALSTERNRIAADMHDDMGAGLSRIRYLSTAMKKETDNEFLKTSFDKLITGSDDLVDKMNDIIWTLNSNDETLEGVLYYLRSQCSEMLDHANIKFNFVVPEKIPEKMISSEEKRNLYLSVKEAVHNAGKHSQATTITLSVQLSSSLKIIVSDDGNGFDVEENKLKGNGLSNYQKRMQALKGTVLIISNQNGTSVIFELPIL